MWGIRKAFTTRKKAENMKIEKAKSPIRTRPLSRTLKTREPTHDHDIYIRKMDAGALKLRMTFGFGACFSVSIE
jgi:hypothetical protein